MSVLGELTRHLDHLIETLDLEADDTAAAALGDRLRALRPREPGGLSSAADQILEALSASGLVGDPNRRGDAVAPRDFGDATHEAAETVAALSRIVLGR